MKIILSGNKTISVKCLEWLVGQGEDICKVFVHPDEKASLDWQESLKEKCKELSIPYSEENINAKEKLLKNLNPDVLFSIQYGPLIKNPVLKIPKLGCINLHNGDLPKYGGCSPIYHAILNGESKIGVTLHYMGENFDTGDWIGKCWMHSNENETAEEIFDEITSKGFQLFKEQFPLIKQGKNLRNSQQGKQLYYRKDVLDLINRNIKWDESAKDVHNRIRVFTFPKRGWYATSCLTSSLNDKKVNVEDSKIEDKDMKIKKYGEIIDIFNRRVFVAARDGVVSLGKINHSNAESYCKGSNIKKGDYFR